MYLRKWKLFECKIKQINSFRSFNVFHYIIIYNILITFKLQLLITRLQEFVTLHMKHDNIVHSKIYLKVTRLQKLLLMRQFLIKSGFIHFYPPITQT